jgi:hypothetical protein
MQAENRAYNSSLDAALEQTTSAHMKSESNTPALRRTSGQAITSLILGILSVIGGGILLIPPILAVILGHLAVSACNRETNLDGKGLAIAGLILGWITLAGWILMVVLFGGLAYLITVLEGY